jgi:hypothetical protein
VHDVPEATLTHDASIREMMDELQALAVRCMDRATTVKVEGNNGKLRRHRSVLIRGRTRTQRQHLTKLEVFKHHGIHALAPAWMQTNHGELHLRTARDDLEQTSRALSPGSSRRHDGWSRPADYTAASS